MSSKIDFKLVEELSAVLGFAAKWTNNNLNPDRNVQVIITKEDVSVTLRWGYDKRTHSIRFAYTREQIDAAYPGFMIHDMGKALTSHPKAAVIPE